RRPEARTEYDRIEQMSPGWAQANARTAFLMAMSPSDSVSEEALELAEQAAESTENKDGSVLEALAASQAGARHLGDALAAGGLASAVGAVYRALALPMVPPLLADRRRSDRETFQRRERLRPPAAIPDRSGR